MCLPKTNIGPRNYFLESNFSHSSSKHIYYFDYTIPKIYSERREAAEGGRASERRAEGPERVWPALGNWDDRRKKKFWGHDDYDDDDKK